jgi:hypothetical protein
MTAALDLTLNGMRATFERAIVIEPGRVSCRACGWTHAIGPDEEPDPVYHYFVDETHDDDARHCPLMAAATALCAAWGLGDMFTNDETRQ